MSQASELVRTRHAPARAFRPAATGLFAAPGRLDGRDGAGFLSRDFDAIGSEARAELAKSVVRRNFGPNEFIYLQDDEAKHLFFVVSGHVRLSYLMDDGCAILHGILPARETFGELGVFENSTYCDMATAIGPLTTAGLSIQSFRTLSARYPEIGQALARAVARRYRSYVTLTRDLSLKSLPARLAQSVLRLADTLGTTAFVKDREVGVLGAIVNQTDLGLMARGSRGNVNRALKSWERAGWIAMRDRSILILDRGRLESLSTDEGF